uniref:Calcineurin-like phosphoesterase domain-containing protein n=1 Tax=Chenopodium quinoa TaxID=63459 RepID=A0A803KUH9_CHEQI
MAGDFGNENVELVRSIANVDMPKAAILGNHDSWSTYNFSKKLGEEHVGYGRLDFPKLKLSVVGGRPFSLGGDKLFRKQLLKASPWLLLIDFPSSCIDLNRRLTRLETRIAWIHDTKQYPCFVMECSGASSFLSSFASCISLLRHVRYGVQNMEESAHKIHMAASGTPEDHSIIFLSHNGPTGLGSGVDDMCGKDWEGGGDNGDLDLAQAISLVKETSTNSIPLVVFGHMHKEMLDGGSRKMVFVASDNTIT